MNWPLQQAEQALAVHTGREHAVLTGSGTTALFTALGALDLPAGSPVLYPDLTCETAVNASLFAGLAPVFADVRPAAAVPTPADLALAAAVTSAAAMIPTHLFGRCGPLPADLPSCPQLVDAAQAAVDPRAAAGGLAVIVSFGAGKQLDLGGGGAILCDDAAFARDCRLLLCTLAHAPARAAQARQQLQRDLVDLGRRKPAGTPAHAAERAALLSGHRLGYLAPAGPELPMRLLAALGEQRAEARRRLGRARLLGDALGRLADVRLLDLASRDVPWRVSFAVPVAARDAVVGALADLGLAPTRHFAPAHRLAGFDDRAFPGATALAEALVNLDPVRLGDEPATAAARAALAVDLALERTVRKEQHAGS